MIQKPTTNSIEYKSGYKYQLTCDFLVQTPFVGMPFRADFYELYDDGYLLIHKGYAWDGPTGGLDTRDTMIGSLAHDCLCQAKNEKQIPMLLKPEIDKYFSIVNERAGMPAWRRWYFYLAVRSNDVLHVVGEEKQHEICFKNGNPAHWADGLKRLRCDCERKCQLHNIGGSAGEQPDPDQSQSDDTDGQ